jgi:hypothetical protein
MRRRRQGDRCIGGVQGGGNEAAQAIDDPGVIRTEDNLVTTGHKSIGRSVDATLRLTNRWPASTASIAGSRSVAADPCERSHGRPSRAPPDLRRDSWPEGSRARVSRGLFHDLESIQLRQIDIEQNQVRLKFVGLPHGLQPIRRLGDLELRPLLQRRANDTAERRGPPRRESSAV